MPSERFSKALRLRKRRQFLQVQGRGTKVTSSCFLALALPNGQPETRLGLTVSSKVGNAVERNRIRRRLRELFRRQRERLPKGLDVVLIAKSAAKEADFATLARSFDAVAAGLSRHFR